MNTVMDVTQIQKALPHRYPFLLVDRIIELTDTKIVGIKQVSINEPFFQGHFPVKPVMPGVLIIEAMAQVGGVMLLSRTENHGKLAYLISVDEARFRKMVVPGDTLVMTIELIRLKSKVGIVKCVATVDGQVACEAQIMFSLGE